MYMMSSYQPGYRPKQKFLQRANHLKGDLDSSKDSSSTPGGLAINNLDEWDVNGHLGADLLLEAVRPLNFRLNYLCILLFFHYHLIL